jgi:hypothetical protein
MSKAKNFLTGLALRTALVLMAALGAVICAPLAAGGSFLQRGPFTVAIEARGVVVTGGHVTHALAGNATTVEAVIFAGVFLAFVLGSLLVTPRRRVR